MMSLFNTKPPTPEQKASNRVIHLERLQEQFKLTLAEADAMLELHDRMEQVRLLLYAPAPMLGRIAPSIDLGALRTAAAKVAGKPAAKPTAKPVAKPAVKRRVGRAKAKTGGVE